MNTQARLLTSTVVALFGVAACSSPANPDTQVTDGVAIDSVAIDDGAVAPRWWDPNVLPDPTTKQGAVCVDEAFACGAGCGPTTFCKLVCQREYNHCLRWTSCSRTYFACRDACTTKWCPGMCLLNYQSCMGF